MDLVHVEYPGNTLPQAMAGMGSARHAWYPPNITPPGFLENTLRGSFALTRLQPLEISITLTLIRKKGGYICILNFSEKSFIRDTYSMSRIIHVTLTPLAGDIIARRELLGFLMFRLPKPRAANELAGNC